MSKTLALAGKLRPEIRLGFALSEFADALEEIQRNKFRRLRVASVTPPTASDVIKATEELNRKGAALHRTWRPFSTRTVMFLSRIQSFASIGDVCIGGSESLIASGVWCAVRVCLELRQ
jgi:ankyrin repeat domain-containing protein 50